MTAKPTSTHRFDAPHQELNAPYILKPSDQKVVEMICRMLDNDEISAREAGIKINRFEGLPDNLLELVNDALPRNKKAIRDPVHAAVMVGSHRLHSFLRRYVPQNDSEVLAETSSESPENDFEPGIAESD